MSIVSDRRCFIQFAAAAASALMWPDAVRAKQTDVVVVGAGAAGMAVARVLIEAGLDVTVVEADGNCREGYGALWAHSARGNTGGALDPGDEDILGRAQLRKPVGERVWFAGEACSPDLWATVAGAHKSGIRTAKSVVAALSSQ